MMQKIWKMTESLSPGYSSESTQRELSNEYQDDRVLMAFKNICVIVLWTKVASTLDGLIENKVDLCFCLYCVCIEGPALILLWRPLLQTILAPPALCYSGAPCQRGSPPVNLCVVSPCSCRGAHLWMTIMTITAAASPATASPLLLRSPALIPISLIRHRAPPWAPPTSRAATTTSPETPPTTIQLPGPRDSHTSRGTCIADPPRDSSPARFLPPRLLPRSLSRTVSRPSPRPVRPARTRRRPTPSTT